MGADLAHTGREFGVTFDPIPLAGAMAKRTRKQKQRAAARRTPTPGVPTRVAPPASTSATEAAEMEDDAALVAPVAAAPLATRDLDAAAPARRRVERVGGAGQPAVQSVAPRPRPGRGLPSGYIQPLDSDDAAIPFDRVPYVPADLRRVGVIAAIMVVLIIVADIIVSNVVK